MDNLRLVSPEMFMLCAICVVLVGDLFVKSERRHLAYELSQFALVITLVLTWWVSPEKG